MSKFEAWGGCGGALLLAFLSLSGCESGAVTDAGVGADGSVGMCPTHLRLTNVATRRDVGWTGLTHSRQVTEGAVVSVEIVDCDAECRRCRVEGPVDNLGVNNHRCLADPSQTCGSDADCAGDDVCRYLYGPPITVETQPGRALCIAGGFEPLQGGLPPISGVVDLATGEVVLDSFNIGGSLNRLDDGTALGGCGVCMGDTVPGDGVQDGRCMKSTQEPAGELVNPGAPCDVHGRGGRVDSAEVGFFSFDCVSAGLTPTDTVEDWGPATTRGVRWSLGASSPACTADGFEGEPCWCGICEDSSQACASDRDCASGSCGWLPPPESPIMAVPTKPDGCVDDCNWDAASGSGTCSSAIFPGTTVGCYPAGLGATIEARGNAAVRDGAYFITMGSLTCSQPQMLPSIDAIVGAPGPALTELQFRMDAEYRVE